MPRSRITQIAVDPVVVGRSRLNTVEQVNDGMTGRNALQPSFIKIITRQNTMAKRQSDFNRHGDVRVEDIFPGSITDIHIGNLSADKITTGTLDASLVTISSADGQMTLAGNLLQIRNASSVIQVSLGNYTGSSYGLAVGSNPASPDISITATAMTINTDSFIKFIGSRCLYQNSGASVNSLVGYQVNQFTIQGDATNGVRINGGTVTIESQDLVIDTGATTKGIQIRDGGRLTFYDSNDTNTIYFKENSSSQLEAFGASTYIWRMTRGGVITQPNQPSFLATAPSNTANSTGDGTVHTVEFDTEVFDLGANFDTGTYTFTAPVGGIYALSTSVLLAGITTLHTSLLLKIVTSNRTYQHYLDQIRIDTSFERPSVTAFADMDANDTATVTITLSGSTKVAEVNGGAENNIFSGSLIN